MQSTVRDAGDGPVAPTGQGDHVLHLDLPGIRGLARHAFPAVFEGTIVPLAVFLAALEILGLRGAIIAGLVWSYGNIARRLVRRQHVPGILLLGALTLTARAVIGLASGSAFVYFLQPTLGTALVGAIFLASVTVDRPLAQRLAADFCPFPDHFADHPGVRRFFLRISLLWSFTQLASATITLWLLVTQSLEAFLLAKSVVSMSLTASAILFSIFYFRRSMARHGITVRWRSGALPVPARVAA